MFCGKIIEVYRIVLSEKGEILNMRDDFNLDITQNEAELEKLCTDSVELMNYARNIVVNHVNIVQIMTYYSLGRWIVET